MTDKITREEAIETVRRCCPRISDSECDFETAMRVLIPELTESEDERIRKGLLRHFKNKTKPYWNEIAVKDIIAYLEKQKPVEYLDKDKVYAIMTKLTNLSYSQLIPINSDEFKKLHEITSEVRDLLDYPIEQKPDTRTADDLQLLGFIYDLLISLEWREDYAMSRDECLRRLKDYRPQKPSWGEEDERTRQNLMSLLANMRGDRIKEETYNKYYPWLKSIRNGIFQNGNTHWKPSEEQMEALEIILRYGDKESTHIKNLTSLYEQLKKL